MIQYCNDPLYFIFLIACGVLLAQLMKSALFVIFALLARLFYQNSK